MRIVHFMNRNTRLPHSAQRRDIPHPHPHPHPYPGRSATLTEARIAVMRAGGMSTLAIRRALGLSEATASAAGLVELGPWLAPTAPSREASSTRGPGGPDMTEVLEAVARGCGIDRHSLVASGQRQPVVRARQLVIYLIRELCPGTSLQAIGFLLDRDHTTVLYGCRRAAALLGRDRAFREAYLRARRALTMAPERSHD